MKSRITLPWNPSIIYWSISCFENIQIKIERELYLILPMLLDVNTLLLVTILMMHYPIIFTKNVNFISGPSGFEPCMYWGFYPITWYLAFSIGGLLDHWNTSREPWYQILPSCFVCHSSKVLSNCIFQNIVESNHRSRWVLLLSIRFRCSNGIS